MPSSPTPFTGYVITVPKSDTIDLPITIEDALKFAVSGGVLIPPSQVIEGETPVIPPAEGSATAASGLGSGSEVGEDSSSSKSSKASPARQSAAEK